jgi:acetolactate synthase regulatory subunit
MLTITLHRNRPKGKAVTGTLALDLVQKDDSLKRYELPTLENADYLIPAGTYPVERTWSPKFKKFLPEILDVPDRFGIRMHRGTKPEHSQGCILLDMAGMTYVDTLFNQLDKYYDDEKVQIEIIDSDAA